MFTQKISDQLDSKGAPLWRQDHTNLFHGIESKGDSAMFKSSVSKLGSALESNRLTVLPDSKQAPGNEMGRIKAAARAASAPGMISLGAGAPPEVYFPFESIQLQVSNAIGKAGDAGKDLSMLSLAKYDFQPGINDYSLDVALNYGQGSGSAQMLRFVTEHTELVHNPPYLDWACCMTVGSTSAWDSTLRIFCEKDDYIIVDKYSFSSALETAWALGIKTLPVAMDDQGLLPDDLDKLLSTWKPEKRNARKPFLLYMVPTGQNPTGATQSLERRKAIYAVSRKHNLYIVEDEPYYYLQLPSFNSLGSSYSESKACELIPSYLSLDVDGRVLRLDSLSKVLAPGSRMGWVTASEQVVEKFIRLNESSSQHPSGFSQAIIYKLLNHHWGHSGFFKWLANIQSEYAWRRDALLQACEKYLPKDIVSWVPSHAGMFQWIEINWKSHPTYKSGSGHQAIQDAIFASAVEQKVFLTPGTCFWSDIDSKEDQMFFRATYASASQGDLTEAVRRFANAIQCQFS
ncbi:uncharacterized protein N7511_001230 [Penicillium nucicola]|uniref:uncharacterized protein n=1 Tax=Penicillium nucicola TaxID=1850975 RepID=UPI00254594BC|nr:uncharacterized protein N7511_001230 [Penicillium nucicola]KAJ5776219.1 hypothetical protein N7511_001230 [Penicillium nucicola]